MAREQYGVCAEPNLHGTYLFFDAIDDQNAELRQALSQIPSLLEQCGNDFSESNLSGVVAIGASYWDEFNPEARPNLLASFPVMDCEDRVAPGGNVDLYIEIRSDRADVNHIVSAKVFDLLAGTVELIEQINAFRYLDGRDLTGFVDGTENPQGLKRCQVALVNSQEDSEFCCGSYLHVQRYRHNLKLWNNLDISQQEDVYGRSKYDNIEYQGQHKPLTAHTARANLKDNTGQTLEILRQSMPYGDMKTQGLLFVSYCHSPKPFELMLKSMIFGDEAGNADDLLKYTQAENGVAFFAPSLTFLAALAD
jgi:putative iron-dependent peroxidase